MYRLFCLLTFLLLIPLPDADAQNSATTQQRGSDTGVDTDVNGDPRSPREIGEKPNVIVIYTDDHGYSDLGCQQVKSDIRTPNIDALAEGGVRMSAGYVTAPQCVPSRGGLLTGQYQNRFGLESNTQHKQEGGLDGFNDAKTVAERLQQTGYATGMSGKWHLGPATEIVRHGFDKVFAKNSNRPGTANFTLEGRDVPLRQESSQGYHLDVCSKAACAFIERYRDQPFFFYLAYRAPHVPLDAPEHYLERFPGEMPERRRKALAMLSAVDDGVGNIMQTLRECGIEENTLVFFISDNGAPLKIHKLDAPGNGPGWDGSLNDPLNGEKGMLTEGGIRTPFLAYWKGVLPANVVYVHPVISLDVAATANAVAGLPDDDVLDGVNLIPYLSGKIADPPHDTLFWRWNGQAAIRQGDWKYIAVGDRQWLFNVREDIGEHDDRLNEHPDIGKALRKDWDAWSNTLQPPGLPGDGTPVAHGYFDWYIDGIRTAKPPEATSGNVAEARSRSRPKKRTPVLPMELFRRRDRNKDDSVTLEEFLNGRSGDTLPILKRRFRSFDRDHDGLWERSEVQNPNSSRPAQERKIFSDDRDSSD